MVTAVVKIHFTIYVLTNFIENAIKSDRAFYQHRVRTRTKTGFAVQVPVHDYKHSKGTLLVTMLPELHLYLIFYVPHYKTIQFGFSTTDNEIKCYLKKIAAGQPLLTCGYRFIFVTFISGFFSRIT